MGGKISIGKDIESVADIKSPTANIEDLTAAAADVGTIFADTYQNLPGGGGGGGGDVDANTIIDALGFTPVAPGDVIAQSNNAFYANVAILANNATYFNGQPASYYTDLIGNAYSNAIAYSGNAAQAYANAIAWSGNAAAAYANAISYAATIAATAYSNAIAFSGNAAAAYANAVSYANTTFLPLAGGTLTGAVYPSSNAIAFGNATARWVITANSITASQNIQSTNGSIVVSNGQISVTNTSSGSGQITISTANSTANSGVGAEYLRNRIYAPSDLALVTDGRLYFSTAGSAWSQGFLLTSRNPYDVAAGTGRHIVISATDARSNATSNGIWSQVRIEHTANTASGASANLRYTVLELITNENTWSGTPNNALVISASRGANTLFSVNRNGDVIVAGNTSITGNVTAHTITANVIGTANNANNLGGQLPAYYANATHGHGFLRHSMTLAGNMDTANSTNFRTTLFGSNAIGYNFSVARWNATVPSFLTNMGQYGTMLGWSGSDTQGFLAVNYNSANAAIGGGSADGVTWIKNLAFLDSNISGTANNATNLGGQPNTYYLNSGNQNAGVLPAARLAQNTAFYTIDPRIPSHGILHNTLSTPSIAEAAIERAYVENKTMFAVPNVVEYSTDSGGSYADASGTITNTMLKNMVLGRGTGGSTGVVVSDQTWTNLRFQWDHASFEFGYVFFNYLYVYYQTAGHTISSILIEKQDNDTSVWSTVATTGSFSGWPSHAWVPHTNIPFSASSGRNKSVRITFTFSWSGTYPANSINLYNINWYGTYPAGKHDRVWSWNTDREVTFANTVQPASNNKNLGISAQRWNLYANVINSTGLATLTTANVTSTAELRGVTTAYANVVPSANGVDLGTASQRWELFATSGYFSANTGFGTATPNVAVHVVGSQYIDQDTSASAPGQLQIRGTANTSKQLLIGFNTTSDYGSLQAIHQGSGFRTLALNPDGANVAIGKTTAGRKLDISGDGIKVDNGTSSAVLELYSTTDYRLQADSNFTLYDVTAGATRMFVAANGNIGLGGNTTPSYALSLTGVMMGSSFIYAGAGATGCGFMDGSGVGHNGRSYIRAPSDGVITLFNGGANSFGRLVFGASNTSFSSIKNNGTELQIRLGDDSAFANLTAHTITANLVGTANNANNLGGQLPAFYTNATNITTGTLPFAQLPSNNSVTNTSISHVPTANNVKTAYDAAIAANTLANTASTKADAAYTNATSFATTIAGTAYSNAIAFAANASNMNTGTVTFALLPSNNSVTNTSISHVPTANNVKTAYDAAIAANTLANTASTKADAAYTNAVAFASNATNISSGTVAAARLPSGNSTVQGAVIVLDSVVNTSITITAAANSVKTAYDVGISANTRAASAQTAAVSAYTNAIAFASNSSNQNTGTLDAARLPASGVTPGTYGNTSVYPVITVDTYGRITSVTTDIDGGGGGGGLIAGDGLTSNATHYAILANTGIIANATGTYVDWASPGPLGATVANSGAFTTLTTTGNTDHGNNNVTGARMKSYKEFNNSLGTISTNNVTLDLSTSNFFDLTLANNAINVTFSNPPASGNVFTFSVIARQDATGSRVLTWPASVKWPNNVTPTLTTTANKIDILQLMTVDGGTSYFGGFSLGNL